MILSNFKQTNTFLNLLSKGKGLQRRGIDLLSAPQARLKGASDGEQLAFATQQQRVMVTQD